MTKEFAEDLKMLAPCDYPIEIVEEYSGRCMNGETTYGVVCHTVHAMIIAVACVFLELSETEDGRSTLMRDYILQLEELGWDQFGEDVIFY